MAAWFLDGDYDGATFCITQAFFPDRDAWEKIARALKTSEVIDESASRRSPAPIAAVSRRASTDVSRSR